MNCIPETDIPNGLRACLSHHAPVRRTFLCFVALFCSLGALQACGIPSSESATETPIDKNRYRLEFVVTPDVSAGGAAIELKVSQPRRLLRQIRMRIDPRRISNVQGDGELNVDGDTVTWSPSEHGGTLRWFATLQHARNAGGYDAFINMDWAIFRAEDIIPRATSLALKSASSESSLEFRMPHGWSSVTPYYGRDNRFQVRDKERRFDLPGGWIVLGKIGVRTETIAGIRVKVAAPEGQDVRRMDILAMLHWTLPFVQQVLPAFPRRLTIISAADPMWRGGLSGPQSLFIHSSRPLISENATSTLLHEVFHVGFNSAASPDMDWLIEGLAEYYSLQFLARSGTISNQRLKLALSTQAKWGETVDNVCVEQSSGAVTARSVAILSRLDSEIRSATKEHSSLDDVTRALAIGNARITLTVLRNSVAEIIGRQSDTLVAKNLPGCGS
jgi:hypothetical protein